MGASLALKIDLDSTLNGLILTEEKIFAANIPLEELCVLEMPSTSYGPMAVKDLRQVLEVYPDVYEQGRLRMFGSESSIELWEHPSFGRRKPKLAAFPMQNPAEEALILVRKAGQEIGPLGYQDLIAMLENKKVDLTDSFSVDGGKNWDRLHHIHALDRRLNLKQDRLPKKIPAEALEESLPFHFFSRKLVPMKKAGLFKGMADSGFLHVAKTASNVILPIPRAIVTKLTEKLGGPLQEILNTKTKKNMAIVGASLTALVLLTSIFVSMLKTAPEGPLDEQNESEMTEDSRVEGQPTQGGQRSRAKTPTAKNSVFRATRAPSLKKSDTSFTKSEAYKRGQLDENNQESYYDDQNEPVEQDEIRRKLSRETINPADPMNNPSAHVPNQERVDEEGRDIIEPAQAPETFIEASDESAAAESEAAQESFNE